jgi:hypothetical protein
MLAKMEKQPDRKALLVGSLCDFRGSPSSFENPYDDEIDLLKKVVEKSGIDLQERFPAPWRD